MRKKLIALALSGSLVAAGFSTGVAAAVVDTQRAVSMDAREQRVAAAQARVAALSDAELAQLEGRLQQLPAGGGALGVIGAVFLVLIILEITGVIDVFKKL